MCLLATLLAALLATRSRKSAEHGLLATLLAVLLATSSRQSAENVLASCAASY